MATIETLEIQIQSETKNASATLDKLVSKLDVLATSLNKIDASRISAEFGKLSEAMSRINGNMFKSFSDSAKTAETSMNKLTKEASKGIKAKATFDISDYQKSAAELGKKFADAGKNIQFSGNFSQLEKQYQALSNTFDKLAEKEQKIISVGATSPESTIFKGLQYDISTTLNKLDTLSEKIKQLEATKPKINISGMTENISKAFDDLPKTVQIPVESMNFNADAMRAVFGESAQNIQNWAQAVNQFGANAGAVLNDFEKNADSVNGKTSSLAEKLNQLDIPPINTTDLTKLQNELSKTEAKWEELQAKLSNELAMGRMTESIDDKGFVKLQEEIKKTELRAEALKKKIAAIPLEKTSKEFTSIATSAKKLPIVFSSIEKSSGRVTNAIGKMGLSFKNLLKSVLPFAGIAGLFNFGKEAIETASSLTEVQNVVDVTFGKYSGLVENMSETSITDFGMSELSAKEISSRFQAMGVAMGFGQEKMADMSVELTKLTADMASFYNSEQEDVAKSLESVFTGTTRPLRQYGIDLTQATLQEWALKNGIDANVSSMTQAEKTMLRYQYVMAQTGAAQGDFERTADSWANQVRILKMNFQQLAGIVGGNLVNAFKPVIKAVNSAMSAIIKFAKVVSESLGKIFGWTYEEGGGGFAQDWENAEDAAGGIADSTGDAAKNIKKMQAGLRAFDELKVINMPTDNDSGTGGGGAGGAGGAGAGASGGWVQGESISKAFESELDTLYKLGEYIGKTLSEAMERINWDSVYEKAKNFGSGLASFLNGLISPELFGNVGKTIAGSLNTALYFLNSFGTTFDWKDFGLSIASGINNFFATFDFAALAETVNVWVQGIWKTLTTAIANIEWGNVWDKIKEFLNNIDIETIAIVIGAITIKKILGFHLASTALSWIGSAISKKIAQAIAGKLGVEIATNAGIGTALKAGLSSAFSSISGLGILDIGTVFGTGTLVEKFAFVSKMLGGIGLVIGGAITAVKSFFDMWENGWGIVGEIVKDIGIALTAVGAVILGVAAAPAAIVAAIVAAVSTIVIVIHDNWDAICEWFSGVAAWIDENVIQPVVGFFQGVWTSVSGFFSNLWDDIVGIWNDASGWFSENVVEPVVSFFVGLATRVQQVFEGLWIIIQAVWKVVSEWFNENVIQPVGELFSSLWEGIKSVWSTVSSWFNENVIIPVANFFKGLWESISSFFSNLWEDIKTIWSVVSGWFDEHIIKPVSNAFKAACEAIGGFFSSLWSGIKKGVAGTMNAVIGGIEGAINWIVDGINGIIGGFNKVVDWAAGVIGVNWGGVDLVPKVSLGRIDVSGYAMGGFPEDGWFRASQGEIMGKFDNGKSVVANNQQITEGISAAVQEGNRENNWLMRQEIELLKEQNEILTGILKKEFGITKQQVGELAQEFSVDYMGRTGRPAYAF